MLAAPYDLNITKSTGISYGFYVEYAGRVNFQRFAQLYAAKHFLEIIIDGDEYTWQTWSPAKGIATQPLLVTSRGLTIRGYGLEDAIEHTFTREEQNFKFDATDRATYGNICRLEQISMLGLQTTTPTVTTPDHLIKTPSKAPSAPRQRPASTPKASKTPGMITIAEIAQELSMEPRVARGILRTTNTPKPSIGWVWNDVDSKAIITLLKGAKK